MRLYAIDGVTRDPFGARRPPEGVRIYHTVRYSNGRTTRTLERRPRREQPTDRRAAWVGRTATVEPRRAETLRDAIARTRPWFAHLHLPRGEHFLFDRPRRPDPERPHSPGVGRADATLVSDPAVEVRRSDIHQAIVRDSPGQGAFAVIVCWSQEGLRRLPRLTDDLVGHTVVFAVGGEVLSAPHLAGPVAGQRQSTLLTFLRGDRELGDALVQQLLEGSDEVHTGAASTLPCF